MQVLAGEAELFLKVIEQGGDGLLGGRFGYAQGEAGEAAVEGLAQAEAGGRGFRVGENRPGAGGCGEGLEHAAVVEGGEGGFKEND